MATSGNQEHFHSLFEYAPISLWEEDFSGIQRLFDGLRQQEVSSLEAYLETHPDFVDTCMQQVVLLHVNRQTLKMLKAGSQEELAADIEQVFRDGMRRHFSAELLALWRGEQAWSGEGINYTLDGQALDILLHWRILPGSEQSWEHVLVTIEDITARKQAERRLQNLFAAAPISLWEEDYSAGQKLFRKPALGGRDRTAALPGWASGGSCAVHGADQSVGCEPKNIGIIRGKLKGATARQPRQGIPR